MPKSYIRLSAGRESLSDSDRRWHLWLELTHYFQVINCLLPPNSGEGKDKALFAKLGLKAEAAKKTAKELAVDAMQPA